MLNFTKRIILVLLMVCPLSFYGQIEGRIPSGNKNFKPINYQSRNYSSKKNNSSIPINYQKNSSKTSVNSNNRSRKTVNYKPIQNNVKYNRSKDFFYLTANLGPTILQGDNSGFKAGVEGTVGVGYQILEYLGAEASLGYTTFDGSFGNYFIQVKEINGIKTNIDLTLNLTNLILGHSYNRKFNVVPHIGAGLIQCRGMVKHKNGKITKMGFSDSEKLHKGGGLNGRIVVGMIPVGIDFNYAITNDIKLHLNAETIWYDTDRLDCIIRTGSPNDYSSSITLGISYILSDKTVKSKKVFSPCEYTF